MKRQPIKWKNIFTDTFDKGLIFKSYKVIIELNTKQTIQLKNGQRSKIDTSPKMYYGQ